MSFSQGFSSAFRSIDGGLQWRASQKQQSEQFDSTLAETQRVNDSRIDLDGAQIQRINAFVNLTNQEIEQNAETHPLKLESLELLNTGQRGLNTSRQLGNDAARRVNSEMEATKGTRVAADNAANRLSSFTSKTMQNQGAAMNSRDLMAALGDENGRMPTGADMARQPQQMVAAIATMGASSEITGMRGNGSVPFMKPHFENGEHVGYYMLEEGDTPGSPMRFDPDAQDENGEPRLIGFDEAAQIYDALVSKLDQSASWAAGGGSARDEKVAAEMRSFAEAEAGPRPEARAMPAGFQNGNLDDLEAEGRAYDEEIAKIEAELATLPVPPSEDEKNDLTYWGAGMGRPGPTISREDTAKRAELESRAANLNQQLQRVGQAASTLQGNEAIPQQQEAWQTGINDRVRGLGNTIRRGEQMNDQPYSVDNMRNLATTGRAGVSASDVKKAAADRQDDHVKILESSGKRTVSDKKGGFKTLNDAESGNRLAAQYRTLVQTNPVFRQFARSDASEGLIQQLGLDAADLAGPGGEPNLLAAYYLLNIGVSAKAVAPAAQLAIKMMNPDGKDMSADQQAAITQEVANVMKDGGATLSPEAVAQRAKLNLQNSQ